jgi:hypothetical protein
MAQFSFSKLEKYLKCSFWYYIFHILGKKVPTDSVATCAGTIVHDTLEQFYGPTDRMIEPVELLDIVWMNRLQELDMLDDFTRLKGIAQDIAQLHVRASAGYKGLDAIRDGDGKPFKQPSRSGAWGQAMRALDLTKRQGEIDQRAKAAVAGITDKGLLDRHKAWPHVSLATVFALTFTFLTGYVDNVTAFGLTPLAQEVPISLPQEKGRFDMPALNIVHFPNGNRYSGYIDMIATDAHGRLYLIDHKTNKDAPTAAKVAHWEQLILYAWAHFQVWGRYPDFIGINNVPNKQLVVVPFDPALIEGALQRAMAAQTAIEREVWIQQSPTAYGSNCYNEYNKQPCEYLKDCHPSYYAQVIGADRWAS